MKKKEKKESNIESNERTSTSLHHPRRRINHQSSIINHQSSILDRRINRIKLLLTLSTNANITIHYTTSSLTALHCTALHLHYFQLSTHSNIQPLQYVTSEVTRNAIIIHHTRIRYQAPIEHHAQ